MSKEMQKVIKQAISENWLIDTKTLPPQVVIFSPDFWKFQENSKDFQNFIWFRAASQKSENWNLQFSVCIFDILEPTSYDTRLLTCFVLITLCCKTKHLRSLLWAILRGWDWLEILGCRRQYEQEILWEKV